MRVSRTFSLTVRSPYAISRQLLLVALVPLLAPNVVFADEFSPGPVVMEEQQDEEPPLERAFIDVQTPILWESTQLAPHRTLTIALHTPDGPAHNFPKNECTEYVSRFRKITFRGNASRWITNARAAGYPISTSPVAGAIVVRAEGRYGHVALVRSVNVAAGTMVLDEANYVGRGVVSSRTVKIADRTNRGYIL